MVGIVLYAVVWVYLDMVGMFGMVITMVWRMAVGRKVMERIQI